MSDTTKLWKIDPSHSEVQFKIKHLVISTVTGNFTDFSGSLKSNNGTFEDAEASFEADINSISTNDEDRDAHLKSDDFFNAEEYPKLTFEATDFEKTGDDEYKVTGDMTIRDTTKKVTLDAVHGGTVEDPYGNTKAGFEVTGSINRKEFGLTWSAVTEAGNVVVGDEVKLQLNLQLVQS